MTLEELKEKISQNWDEITILDVLGIDAEQLVERFEDVIEEKFDKLCKEFETDENE